MTPRRGGARWLASLGPAFVTLVLLATARVATAQPPPPETPSAPPGEQEASAGASLDYVQCVGLDVAETERLLRVELAVIAARVERARAPSVRVECKKNVLHIEVKDPASGGQKALTLPAPRVNTPDRERTVAIAASQLFLSSWLEMITGKPPPEEAPTPPTPPKTPAPPLAAPEPMADVETEPETERGPTGWELLASGSLRFRHLSSAVRTIAPALLLRWRFRERWLLQAELGAETAETARATGDIDWLAGRTGLAFGMRLGSRPYFLDALVSSSVMLIRAAGDPRVTGVRGEDRTAAAFDLALSLAPSLSLSRFRLALVGEVGLLAPNVTARVWQDEPVSIHGPWAGVGLALGGEIAQ